MESQIDRWRAEHDDPDVPIIRLRETVIHAEELAQAAQGAVTEAIEKFNWEGQIKEEVERVLKQRMLEQIHDLVWSDEGDALIKKLLAEKARSTAATKEKLKLADDALATILFRVTGTIAEGWVAPNEQASARCSMAQYPGELADFIFNILLELRK